MGRGELWPVWAIAALTALALGGCGGAHSNGLSSRPVAAAPAWGASLTLRSCPRAVRGLGMIALAARGRFELIDLASCRARVLAGQQVSGVSFSPDGRWLAYWPLVHSRLTGPAVVSAGGGRPRAPLGRGIIASSWAPNGELLYGITAGGSLLVASPTGGRRVISARLGRLVSGAGFGLSPNGRGAVVDRSSCHRPVGELDTINIQTGARTVAVDKAGRFFTFAGFSPDGRWLLFWSAPVCSASLAADGWPLDAVPASGGRPVRAVSHMLLYADFLSWCGAKLIAAAGPGRETQTGSAVVETGPLGWRERTIQPARRLSWVSPSCSPSGRLVAAAAGPNNARVSFGHEHRSIWLLHTDGTVVRRLSSPPAPALSDEAPRFSRDGRWVMFVRTRVVPVGSAAISRETIELVPAIGGNAVPVVNFTSSDFGYYDHFGWADEIDWHPPR
jgi:hypothetical protein